MLDDSVLDDEGSMGDGQPDDDEPAIGDDDDADPAAGDGAAANFRDALVGYRSYGCTPGAEGEYTTEFIEAFTEEGLVYYDTWLYEEPDCVTRPLTFNRTLELQSWELGDAVLAADGRMAYAIDYTTIQQGNDGAVYGDPVGTVVYDIVGIDEGGVAGGEVAATDPAQRTDRLLGPFPAEPLGVRAEPASREALLGTWEAACRRSKTRTRTLDEQSLVDRVRYYTDTACTEFYAETITTWTATYGEPTVSAFGQPVMRTTIERISARYGDLVIGGGVPAPPELGENGAVFEDIWGVIAGELLIGTCLDKRPEDCGVGENVPDLLNMNVGDRFFRQ